MAKQKSPTWDAAKSATENARSHLPKLVMQYFQAGRRLFENEPDLDTLHQFRLETKRFRYTLELFRPRYGPGLEQRLALLKEVQQHLGDINDCATTMNLLQGRLPERSRRRDQMMRFLENRATKKSAELRDYWQTTFDAPGQEALWSNYLTRFGRDKKRR